MTHGARKMTFIHYETHVFQSTYAYECLVTSGASKLLHFCMSCDFFVLALIALHTSNQVLDACITQTFVKHLLQKLTEICIKLHMPKPYYLQLLLLETGLQNN